MATAFSLSNLPLEGDGVVENLFHYLWCKDELDEGPCINIPDTIIYKFRSPAYWYFTSKSGQIKRKSRYNLANIRIEEAFTRKVVGSDVVAYYLSTNAETGVTTIEYFDRASFRDFLYNREKVDNGILQKFVEPRGTHNVMIRGVWSPKILLLERRENLRSLSDTKYSLYERAVTYDGAEHFSRAAPVRGSILPISVQEVCKSVVTHVSEVSFRKCNISRMALNFKVDGEDRIWLLWCTSLRLERTVAVRSPAGSPSHGLVPLRQKLSSKQGPVSLFPHCQVPESVQKAFRSVKPGRGGAPPLCAPPNGDPNSPGIFGHDHNNKLVPVDEAHCNSCGSMVLSDRFYRVHYKTIVAHFERFMAMLAASAKSSMQVEWPPNPRILDAVGRVGLGPLEKLREALRASKDKSKVVVAPEDIEIPPIIRDQHPNLTASDYRRFRRDPMFLYKSATVCEECYLVFAKISGTGGTEDDPLAVIGGDNSEQTHQRIRTKSELAATVHVERNSRGRKQERLRRQQEKELRRAAKHSSPLRSNAHNPIMAEANELIRRSGPELPPRIDDKNIGALQATASQPVLQSNLDFAAAAAAASATGRGGDSRSAAREDVALQSYDGVEGELADDVPEAFRQELQERENAFFRDLYKSGNLRHDHPLSHLVSSHAKLTAISGGVAPRKPTSAGSELGVPAPRGGQSRGKGDAGKFRSSPYARTQVAPNPGLGTGRHGATKRRPGKGRDQAKLDPLGGKHAMTESESAAHHRKFLLSTLQHVRDELAVPMPLYQAVGLDRAADEGERCLEEGKSLDSAWEVRNAALAATPSDLGRILRSSVKINGQRLMGAVDVHGENFVVTVFDPRQAVSQRIDVPLSVVLENAPSNLTKSEELAQFLLESLEEAAPSDLFPHAAVSVRVRFMEQP
eukprot:CAMPEP_0202089550 /NCGR_PEP_ID=MMETSP0964-20121228/41396_1 /ASSEMBLY_ACC=CAM_ASM_000500 /TAXON_ID=4773 /ORGANISM="Schizochytrium aggregatum, Strain ATCC28209" /LENGTH=909 /DNA_ID=CAMNT_0048657643 /DNA_START=1 /DNA_END=2730 /DNA_ORIENTATION=-